MHSDDRGLTWSSPRDITSTAKLEAWTWYATGPGAGIQLRSGRLLAAANHVATTPDGFMQSLRSDSLQTAANHVVTTPDEFMQVFFCYNGGIDWELGGSAGGWTNEATLAQLPNADVVVMNMRQIAGAGRRLVAISNDGGVNWSNTDYDAGLIEPGCQGHLIALPAKVREGTLNSGGLFFSNPNSAQARIHVTVKFRSSSEGGAISKIVEYSRSNHANPTIASGGEGARTLQLDEAGGGLGGGGSGDGGLGGGGLGGGDEVDSPDGSGEGAKNRRLDEATLSDGAAVADAQWRGHGGFSLAYSALALLGDEAVGVLYENGRGHPYERISLKTLPLSLFELLGS
ncbi:Sialidase [Pavlovales sp. CCMP2436]|nr:Sialidase [Pavlovales sp. CCMP2436]